MKNYKKATTELRNLFEDLTNRKTYPKDKDFADSLDNWVYKWEQNLMNNKLSPTDKIILIGSKLKGDTIPKQPLKNLNDGVSIITKEVKNAIECIKQQPTLKSLWKSKLLNGVSQGTNVNENAHSYLRKAENHFSGRISLPILELNLGLVINNINNNIDSASCKRDNYISQILWQELFTQRFNPHLYYNIKKKISYQHLKNCKFRCKWKYTEWTETEIAKLNKYMLQVTEGTYIKERALEDQYKYISRVILEDSKKNQLK